jgi:hypothetical protein
LSNTKADLIVLTISSERCPFCRAAAKEEESLKSILIDNGFNPITIIAGSHIGNANIWKKLYPSSTDFLEEYSPNNI